MTDSIQEGLLSQVNDHAYALGIFLEQHSGITQRYALTYQDVYATLRAAGQAYERGELKPSHVETFKQKAEAFMRLEQGHSS